MPVRDAGLGVPGHPGRISSIPAIISAVTGETALWSQALPEEVPGKGLR